MALYLGNNKNLKIIIDGVLFSAKMGLPQQQISDMMLLSSDGYILKDFNNLYLTVKEEK